MHGIESATVQYDEEVKRGLISQKQKTAMVAIQTSGGQLEEGQVKAIRNVIASSYAGLERQHITITDMTSGFSYGGAIGPDGTPEDESLYAAHKQRFEREWQRKLREHFSYIKGILVAINVELNPEVEQSTQTVKIDSKPVTVATKEFSKESSSQSPHVAGRPGAASNGVVGNTAVNLQQTAGGGPESQTTESGSDIKNIPGYEQMSKKTVSLTPKKVTASIDVPASYYEQIWTKRNPPTTGKQAKPPDAAEIARIEAETKKRIEETVRNLLPDLPKGETPYPHIVVSTYTDLPSSPAVPPSLVATTGTWLADNWQTLALIGVGLMSLLMLRSMVRSPATVPTTAAATGEAAPPRLAVHDTAEEEEDPEPAKVLRSRFRSSGPDLKAELHEIVKENPDAAATILKAWIGEAA
jgi:flagellar M-ring protein FliF